MTMIEKVARALCRQRIIVNVALDQIQASEEFINRAIGFGWKDFTLQAKASIEAMREPTEEMIANCSDLHSVKGTWVRMIDAALKE